MIFDVPHMDRFRRSSESSQEGSVRVFYSSKANMNALFRLVPWTNYPTIHFLVMSISLHHFILM